MMIYNNIALFVRLVEVGSYLTTAKIEGVSPPTLTRKIQELELALNVILLVRSARNITLTKEGKILYLKFKNIRHNLNELLNIYNSVNTAVSDSLNVLLPPTLSVHLINPHLKEFKEKHPSVNLLISYADSLPNLDNNNFDLILTHHDSNHPNYNYRFLRKESVGLYCTPEYVKQHGLPEAVDELSSHEVINSFYAENLQTIDYLIFSNRHTDEQILHHLRDSKLHVNTVEQSKELGLCSLGIFSSWDSLCAAEVLAGKLIHVLPDYETLGFNFYLLSRKKLRVIDQDFIDFLHGCMNNGKRKRDKRVETEIGHIARFDAQINTIKMDC